LPFPLCLPRNPLAERFPCTETNSLLTDYTKLESNLYVIVGDDVDKLYKRVCRLAVVHSCPAYRRRWQQRRQLLQRNFGHCPLLVLTHVLCPLCPRLMSFLACGLSASLPLWSLESRLTGHPFLSSEVEDSRASLTRVWPRPQKDPALSSLEIPGG
jgi:hypothetical protein